MAGMFDSNDEGKRVVTKDGDTIGTVREVQDDQAHVETDSGLAESIRQRLGMDDDSDTYVLREDDVDTHSDDEIQLRN